MSVALIRDGVIRPSENDSHVLTAMLPSSCPQNHAANILPLPDGALMCVWFAGTQEGIADISVWGLLTSTCATFTGSNMGSVYIFAPIAIAACTSLGLNPTAAAIAVVISGWNGGYMPIDGMPAMILGMGKYKLPEFWVFSVPMYLIRILALCAGAVFIFPM